MAKKSIAELTLHKLEYGVGAPAIPYDGSTRYVRITDIDDDGCLGADFVSPEYYEEKHVLQDGDILFARTGATVGKSFMYTPSYGKCVYAGFLIRMIPNKEQVLPSYVYYFTKSPSYNSFIAQNMKVVAQPNINAKQYASLTFEVPSLPDQAVVVKKLDKITTLISLRKQQIAKLDELVKTWFVEMFGDPVSNPKGWDKVNISTVVASKVSNGFFAKRDDYCDDGNVSVLGVAHIVNRMYSNTVGLPKTNGTAADVAKYGVKYGDMLFCRSSLVAEGIGKASIVPQDVPENVLFECHVIRLPLDLEKCVPEFMQVLSTTEYFRSQVIAQSKTATMTTIGQDGILKTEIILPPLELQKHFQQFVAQTDQQKLTIQQSLDKMETLKKALMQKYFG